jgi:hypothetical protein
MLLFFMGDRSPKAVQKSAAQKQSKNQAQQKGKNAALAAKQAGNSGKRSK